MTCHQTMVFAFYVATAFVLIVSRPIFAEINCEEDVHVNCPGKTFYSAVTDSENGVFSEKVLFEHCSDILEDLECKTNYLNVCDSENSKMFSLMTNGLRELFFELCNETSDLREGYRQHVKCFQNASENFRNCALIALQAAHKSKGARNIGDDEERIRALCTLQRSFRVCSKNEVRKMCGEDAAKFLSTFYTKALQELVVAVC